MPSPPAGDEPSPSSAATARGGSKGRDDASSPPSTSSTADLSQREPLGKRQINPPPPVATLLRALASAGEILADGDLRTRAANALRAGVRTAASEAPRRAREAVHRAQQHAAAARLARGLAAERDAAVDVQVGGALFEDAPQELRSRMWVAVLEDDSLFGSVVASEEDEGEGGEGEQRGAREEFLRSSASSPTRPPPASSASSLLAPSLPVEGEGRSGTADAWEMVQGSSNLYPLSSASKLEGIGNKGKEKGDGGDGENAADGERPKGKRPPLRDRALEGALSSPWPLPSEYSERGRYNHLVSAPFPPGDDTDDAVGRDIGRTFPEHPQFGYAHGRAALARVLRAAALADPAVGYCQGMAFVAGVLLMYLPEELSFRVLTERLLGEQEVLSDDGGDGGRGGERGERDGAAAQATAGEGGPERGGGAREVVRPPPTVGGGGGAGLRTLYEPGLSGLKSLLAQYEWLLERIAPEVSARLTDLGIPPVLYAAQWMLTAFACPFPPHVAARVLDAVLLERSPAPLVRAALAVVVELGPSILASSTAPPSSSPEARSQAADFEAALAVLKLEPQRWTREKARSVLSRGLCAGDLVPTGSVEAAAAAVGASAAAEARREEEGRREREREREERESEREAAAEDERDAASAAAREGTEERVPPSVSSPPSLSRLSRDADPSIASLELALEGLSWSGAAAAEDDDDDDGDGGQRGKGEAAAAAEGSSGGDKAERKVL